MDIKRIIVEYDNISEYEIGIIECINGNIYECRVSNLEKIFDIIDDLDYNLDDLPRILRIIYYNNKPLLASNHPLLLNRFYKLECIRGIYQIPIYN